MHFEKIPGSIVIISKNGTQYQREAATRKNSIFIINGSGYIGLRHKGTSVNKTNLVDYDLGELEYGFTATGQACLKSHPGYHYDGFGNYEDDSELTISNESKTVEKRKAKAKAKPRKKSK